MRTQKVTDCSYSWYYDEINDSSFYDEVTTVNKPTTRYFYDGQMACEEDFAEIVPNEDPFFEVTRYGLGARGIDWIEKATVEDTSISFPIYDGHGNVIAQLGRTGSSYSLTQVKSYDVWGGVRSGALGPAGRYCGNLGHVSDDESGLIYMRARYYEPGSGRFISEDPAMDGQNWYAYCGNDPVNYSDATGRFPWLLIAGAGGAMAWSVGYSMGYSWFIDMLRSATASGKSNTIWGGASRDDSIAYHLSQIREARSGWMSEFIEEVAGVGIGGFVNNYVLTSSSIALGPLGATVGFIGTMFGLGVLCGFYNAFIEAFIINAAMGDD